MIKRFQQLEFGGISYLLVKPGSVFDSRPVGKALAISQARRLPTRHQCCAGEGSEQDT